MFDVEKQFQLSENDPMGVKHTSKRKSVGELVQDMQKRINQASPLSSPKYSPHATSIPSYKRRTKGENYHYSRYAQSLCGEEMNSVNAPSSELNMARNHHDKDSQLSRSADDVTYDQSSEASGDQLEHNRYNADYKNQLENNHEDWDQYSQEDANNKVQNWLQENEDIIFQEGSETSETASQQPKKMESTNQQEEAKEENEDQLISGYKKRLQQNDNTVMFEMFELLLTKLSQMETNIKCMKRVQNSVSNKVRRLTTKHNTASVEVNEIGKITTSLVKATVKCEQEMIDISKKVEKIQSRQCKGGLYFHGIPEQQDELVSETIESFFKDQMQMSDPVEVTSVYRIGKKVDANRKQHRPIYVKLYSADEVGYVFAHAKNLAGKTNIDGTQFSIKEHLTEKEQESQQRARDIKMENSRMDMEYKVPISMRKGKIQVGKTPYQKAVTEPKITDVLLMSEDTSSKLQEYKISIGPEYEEKGSKYYSYAAEVTTLDQVKDVYLRLKKLHLAATHCICGYRIFSKDFYSLQDFCDDNEIGGGRYILNQLKSVGVFNIAVFVIRYYGGANLGQRRFDIIADLTKETIAQYPGKLEYGNGICDTKLLASLAKAVKRPAITVRKNNARGRATARGRSQRRGGRNN